MKTFQLLRQLWQLGIQVRIHGSKDARFIQDQANDILNFHHKSLDDKFYRPIKHYTAGLRITGSWFATLRGYPLSKKEIMAGRYLAAMTPLFDALFDDEGLGEENIRDAISSESPENENIILLHAFRDNLYDNVKNKELIEHFLEKIIQSQVDSLRQKEPGISLDEIRQITNDKGGFALLGCRSILDHPLDVKEQEAVYQLGALVQLCNDVFDVWEDTRKGIKTLVDGNSNLASLRSEYLHLINSVLRFFESLNYKKPNLHKFFMQMILIIGRGLVCIDFLEKSQAENNGVFNPRNMQREQLICDMEKPGNFLKSLKYSLNYQDFFIN
ncbi:MAG: hypothetical protein U9R60_07315 [Bacteroidota bacterium]|nr:hypothetical protein [Bacteroidota bacterium]